jgi:hypothetical protein
VENPCTSQGNLLNTAACTTTTPRCVRSVQSFELSFFTLVLAFNFAPAFLPGAAFRAPDFDDFALLIDFALPIDFVLRIEVPRFRGDVFLVATILSV